MSTSSSTPIQTQLRTMRRRAIRREGKDRPDHALDRSVTSARVGRVVALLRSQNGHWAMAGVRRLGAYPARATARSS
jgi:hypothetical protein